MQTKSRPDLIEAETASAPPRWTAARNYRRLTVAVALTDISAFLGAILLAALVRRGHVVLPSGRLRFFGVLLVAQVGVFAAFRLYSISRLSPAEEFRRLIGATTVSSLAIVILAFWLNRNPAHLWVILSWAFALALVLTLRRLWHRFLMEARRRGRLAFRTLIVGEGPEAEHLEETFAARYLGFRVVGQVSSRSATPEATRRSPFGLVGKIQRAIWDTQADCLFVASTSVSSEEMASVARAARLEGVEVRLSANISNIASTRLAVQPIGSMMALTLKPVKLTGLQAVTKRAIDICVSLGVMILGFPVFGAIALAVKLESKGALFYRQQRVGRHSIPFEILKFRTMVNGADKMLDGLRHLNEVPAPLFKLRRDPRVTTVGRFLRRYSLDELPQLWNVLKGEMSVVGPRPSLPAEVALYDEWQLERLEVLPGVTGLGQINGRSDLDFDDTVRLDLFYIENWSPAFDLYIMARTIPAMLSRRGAY
jgi:exopolysaccharide biosynthesis polyprenyl glycosylphosphotransferase